MTSPRNLHQLLLVKQLYEDAHLHAEREDSFSHTKAVILLDLSVEVMLNNLVLNLDPDLTVNASKGSADTDRRTLWGNAATALHKATGKRLSEFREMAGLHALRNLVQHNGTEPARNEVSRYVSAVESMLAAAFRNAYDLTFVDFRIWDLVTNAELRQLLRDCEYALDKGHPEICIFGCSHAHGMITAAIRSYTKFRQSSLSRGLRSRGGQSSIPSNIPREVASQIQRAAKQLNRAILDEANRFSEAVMHEIEFLEDEVVTIGVGMPLMDTRRFRKIGGEFFYTWQGTIRGARHDEEGLNKEEKGESARDARFMLNYLSRLVRLIEDAYPGLLNEVKVRMPLREQKFWSVVGEPVSSPELP